MIFDPAGTEVMGTRSLTWCLIRIAIFSSSAASQRAAPGSLLASVRLFRTILRFFSPSERVWSYVLVVA